MITRFKKLGISLLIPLVALASLVSSLAAIAPAQAAGLPVVETESLPAKEKSVLETVWEFLKTAVLNAVVRLVSYTIRKVAYDGAVWLASGGKGQTPFAHTKDFGGYLSDVGNEAFGAAIESLADPRSGIGINLCKIPDIKVDLAMKVGLRLPGFSGFGGAQASQKPSCSFTEFSDNWGNGDAWKSRFNAAGKSIEQQFNSAMSSADQTDFGIYLGSKKYLDATVATKVAGDQLQRLEGQGYQAKKTLVSNQITTPAGTMKKELEHNTPSTQQEKDEQQIAALLSSGDIKVLPTILGIFINTLASTMVKNYQEKGMLPFGIGYKGNSPAAKYESGGVLSGLRQAQEYFSSILQSVEIKQINQYVLEGQLSSCPDSPGIYNCRADSELVQALKRTENGEPMTIGRALKEGKLRGKWELYSADRPDKDTDKNCYQSAYCYSNIRALRLTRILPLGFEIAASRSPVDHPWTLGQVVGTPPNYEDGFNDCARDAQGRIFYDPAHKPFCHLIDPNWVLKLEPTQCRASVWGSTLLAPGTPSRNQECADLASCITYDDQGRCANYGYCTREKNVWAFGADKCDAQNRTCHTYQDANGQTVSYLYRTLNTGFCAENNVGCNFYSLTQDKPGKWQGPGQDAAGNNSGIYLNNKISDSCSTNSAGCSQFFYASSTNVTLYLRQAPNYLGCYDSDPAAPGVQRPDNTSELNKLPETANCLAYAQACIKDEVGCNLYTPLGTGDTRAVPGKYTADNLCAPQCVGYDSYREMPSHYSNGQAVAYIIPSSNAACSSKDAGCTGFTSLKDISAGGAEQVEYFSYLRPCVLPGENAGKNFFTYEGSLTGGFQLQTYRLVTTTPPEDLDPANPNNEPGAPKYFYRTPEDKALFASECNKTVYTRPGANLDCRQFNDDAGKVYYRLLSKTIPVAAACTPYRLNDTELYTAPSINDPAFCANEYKGFWDPANKECKLCFQNGEYRDGQCFYNGLPGTANNSAGTSRACEPSANSCREYKGNAGNNIKVIVDNTFEDASTTAATANWAVTQGIFSLSPESTRVGGHSLGYTGAGTLSKSLTLAPGESYDLTFWAKGTGSATSVSLVSAENKENKFKKDFGAVSPGDTWNLYHLGPIELSDQDNLLATTSFRLSWTIENRGSIFLDNVRLVQVAEDLYLVKNSLRVDDACDSAPEDNLPGEALGCKAYKDPAGHVVDLTSFSFLCREKAIGCTPVYDTQNTPAESGSHLYNVWLNGGSGSLAVLDVGLQDQNPKCQIPVGQSGCYVNAPSGVSAATIAQAGGALVTSTIAIPADTSPSTPLYLVANKAATCNQTDLGCTYAGKQQATPTGATFATMTIKNDPALYNDQLCIAEAVGCNSYTDTSGGNVYFKDPVVNGQKICEYKSEVDIKGAKYSGWFWKGVGECLDNKKLCLDGSVCASPKVCQNNPAKACGNDGDCGAGDTCVDSCQGAGKQACYPNYLQDGSFGLWSYGDTPRYDNFVGVCPAEQDQCTEFVDHNDNDYAHYLIKNSKIGAGDCNGLVSQKTGCALFDQTDNPNKYWSTKGSYDKSNAIDGKLAQPYTDPVNNDANILIKVKPDRQCGEWLQCETSHSVWDNKTNSFQAKCDQLGRCAGAVNGSGECAKSVDGRHDYASQVLSPDIYISRSTTWSGQDYSGYSVLGEYPPEELSQVNLSKDPAKPDWRLVKLIACGGDAVQNKNNCTSKTPSSSPACDQDGPCGPGHVGQCINHFCVQDLTGVKNQQGQTIKVADVAPKPLCRAYPEPDAPFPNSKDISSIPDPNAGNTGQSFASAHFCNETAKPTNDPAAKLACECDYTKADYGNGAITKYWSYNNPNALQPTPRLIEPAKNGNFWEASIPANADPAGICQGGSNDGRACDQDSDCFRTTATPDKNTFMYNVVQDVNKNPIIDGTCQKKQKETQFVGWHGYCLELDLSRIISGNQNLHPCLTWLPLDSVIGVTDLYNNHREAGYKGTGAQCLQANLFKRPAAFWECHDGDEANCTDEQAKKIINYPQEACPEGYMVAEGYCGGPLQAGGNEVSCPGFGGEDWYYWCVPKNSFNNANEDCSTLVQDINKTPSPDGDKDKRAALQEKIDKLSSCIARYAIPLELYDNGNSGSFPPFAYCWNNADASRCNALSKYLVGCQVAASVDNTKNIDDVIAWTNRVWANNNNKGTYTLQPDLTPNPIPQWTDKKFFGPRLEYTFATPPTMSANGFGHVVNVGKHDKFVPLITPWCFRWSGGDTSFSYFGMPDMTGDGALIVCANDGTNQGAAPAPLDKNNSLINDGRSFNPWEFGIDTVRLGAGRKINKSSNPYKLNRYNETPVVTQFGSLPDAKKLMQQLFVKVIGGSKWPETPDFDSLLNNPPNEYRSDASINWNVTDKGDGQKAPPNLPANLPPTMLSLPMYPCRSGERCLEGKGFFSVNNQDSGEVMVPGSPAQVNIKFFGYADKDHMPLRSIKIDWDDGQIVPYAGLYRNHRGYKVSFCAKKKDVQPLTCYHLDDSSSPKLLCKSDGDCVSSGDPKGIAKIGGGLLSNAQVACDLFTGVCAYKIYSADQCPTGQDSECSFKPVCVAESAVPGPDNFGVIADKTCDSNYFRFDHTYAACSPADSKYQPVCEIQTGSFPRGCCKYTPKVQLKDNWGWCTGGNYDGNAGGENKCDDPNNTSAWQPFDDSNGAVYVAPIIY